MVLENLDFQVTEMYTVLLYCTLYSTYTKKDGPSKVKFTEEFQDCHNFPDEPTFRLQLGRWSNLDQQREGGLQGQCPRVSEPEELLWPRSSFIQFVAIFKN